MAISNPVSIGTMAPSGTSSATCSFVTTAAVPPGGKIFLFTGWFHATATISSVTAPGVTFTAETPVSNGSDHEALIWGDVPSGLPVGVTVTLTFSAASTSRYFDGCYSTGVAAGAPTQKATSTTGSTTWTSGNLTVPSGSLLIGGCYSGSGLNTVTNTPSGGNTELFDHNIATDSAQAVEYQIGTGAAIAVSGTWSAAGTPLAIIGAQFDAGTITPNISIDAVSASTADLTSGTAQSHPGTAAARAAVVAIADNGAATDRITAVTYGGATMTRIRQDSEATEAGTTTIYWLDNVATGTQNVVVTHTGAIRIAVTTLAVGTAGNTVAVDGQATGTSASVANPSWNMTTTAATQTACVEVIHSGLTTMTTTPATGWVAHTTTGLDRGAQGWGGAYTLDNGGVLACGWTAATADDFVGSSAAFKEVTSAAPAVIPDILMAPLTH